MRLPGGTWRSLVAPVPGGEVTTDVVLGPDTSPKQIKMEVFGNKVLRMFQSELPDHAWQLRKREGIISFVWATVARLVPREDAPLDIQWNLDFDAVGLDRERLLSKARDACADPLTRVRWG